MPFYEYGPCAHAVRTCEWVCPDMFDTLASITMRWSEAKLTVKQDTVPIIGEDNVRFDAIVFTAAAYDLFVLPDLIVTHGYDTARDLRKRHHACIKHPRIGICVHRIECDWVCPRIGGRDLITWDSKHNLRNVFDALVLTPSAYARFALPFQVRNKGPARAEAMYQGYLRRVRSEKALDKGIWPKAKLPAQPAGGKKPLA